MSSRNAYLSADERARAAVLYATLKFMAEQLNQGCTDFERLEAEGHASLLAAGFVPDYVSIRRVDDLAVPASANDALVVLMAARLGATRLIDNIRV